MNLKIFSLIITCVTLSAVSQLVMKIGMSSSPVQSALALGSRLETAWAVATNIHVILGLGMYVLGAGMWLLVLSKADISLAYPFVGLGFILTMLLGWLFLDESVGIARLTGTLLIAIGAILVARS
jgi:multidrug transporter EmrE-like cation transporter